MDLQPLHALGSRQDSQRDDTPLGIRQFLKRPDGQVNVFHVACMAASMGEWLRGGRAGTTTPTECRLSGSGGGGGGRSLLVAADALSIHPQAN